MNFCETKTIEWLNLAVLFATFGAVFWYTIINRGVLSELVRQRRLSVMPTLLPEVKTRNGSDFLLITNIGNGSALNIDIDDVFYLPKNLPDSCYRFDKVPVLKPMESLELHYTEIFFGKEEHQSDGLVHLKVGFAISSVQLQINFQDVQGTQYLQVYQMGKGGNKQISTTVKQSKQKGGRLTSRSS